MDDKGKKMVSEKIIIFGMGSIYKRRIKQFDFSKIVAVTDNQILSGGAEYSDLKIIRPEEIKTLEFDFVVICTGYIIAKEIYTQLSQVIGVPETKIISEKKYFEKTSWTPRTLLEVCRGLKIYSLTNTKKYFQSYGILSNSNVLGEDFSDITLARGNEGKAVLLGELSSKDKFDKYETEIYKFINKYRFILLIININGQKNIKAKAIEGYSINYVSGLDMQLILYKKQEKVSIYVATHKDYTAPMDNIYSTLWLGNKKSNNISFLSEVGDNIAFLNLKINECTGLYWLWKHAKDDILGLNHYRRFFKLTDSKEILTEKEVRLLLEEYDILVGNAVCTCPMTNSEYIENSINDEAFNNAKQLVQNAIMKYQLDYAECYMEVMSGYAFFPCNMFITRKELFDQYCEWLFSIIIPAAELFDEAPYDDYSKRAIGFFAERLLTVWLCKHDYRIKELPILLR